MKQRLLESIKNLLTNEKKEVEQQKKKKILLLSEDETAKVLEAMTETNKAMHDYEYLRLDVKLLHDKLDILISQEQQTQTLMVNMMTSIEEILHTLEEAGLIDEDFLYEKEIIEEDIVVKSNHKHDDVASESIKAKKYISDNMINQENNMSKRKFDLN